MSAGSVCPRDNTSTFQELVGTRNLVLPVLSHQSVGSQHSAHVISLERRDSSCYLLSLTTTCSAHSCHVSHIHGGLPAKRPLIIYPLQIVHPSSCSSAVSVQFLRGIIASLILKRAECLFYQRRFYIVFDSTHPPGRWSMSLSDSYL